MKEKLNDKLVRSILDALIFFEFSSDETIDPDASMEMVETIAANLQSLKESEKKELLFAFIKVSTHYPPEQKEFIRSLPASLGIN